MSGGTAATAASEFWTFNNPLYAPRRQNGQQGRPRRECEHENARQAENPRAQTEITGRRD
jgi:hypothetical protein